MVDLFQTKLASEEVSAVTLEPGSLIKKRYLVQNLIGQGASATVYKAIDTHLGSLAVALKVFTPQFTRSAQFQHFYAHELQAGFKVDHENVVRLYDMVRTKGLIALVNEFIDGITLEQLAENWGGRLKPAVVKEIVLQTIRGLEAIHAQGIIHHDVKPQNILVATNGFVKISDFGVSQDCLPSNKELSESRSKKNTAAERLNHQQQLTGTPYYSSPEYLTDGTAGIHQDLYAVGIMMHELLHGIPLFDTSSLANFIDSKLEHTIPPLLSIYPNCPTELAAIADRLLINDPNNRYKSTREVRLALEQLNLPNPGIALKPTKKRKVRKKSWVDRSVDSTYHWAENLIRGLVSMIVGFPAMILTGIARFFKTFFTSSIALYPIVALVLYLVLNYTSFWSALVKLLPK